MLKFLENLVLRRLLWSQVGRIETVLKNLTKSWQTSVVGVLTAAMAWGHAVIAILDGVASTQPNWTLAVSATVAAVTLLLASDPKKE